MFGKRGNEGFGKAGGVAAPPPPAAAAVSPSASPSVIVEPNREPARSQVTPPPMQTPQRRRPARTDEYYDTKAQVFSALIDTIDLSQLAKLDAESAREEIRDIVNDIITIKNFALSISEQE
jgi:pilus assembly protein CpaF